jgi:hypothetical protein
MVEIARRPINNFHAIGGGGLEESHLKKRVKLMLETARFSPFG